jgi:hypothetical protein
MKTSVAHDERMANMTFATVYPLYLEKIKKKSRTEEELDEVIKWLTGFNKKKIEDLIKEKVPFKTFFKNAKLNPYIAMFLCTLIELEKYKWAFGRKWRPIRMPKSTIKLPATPQGEPDWQFMENYIKSLPFSSSL